MSRGLPFDFVPSCFGRFGVGRLLECFPSSGAIPIGFLDNSIALLGVQTIRDEGPVVVGDLSLLEKQCVLLVGPLEGWPGANIGRCRWLEWIGRFDVHLFLRVENYAIGWSAAQDT